MDEVNLFSDEADRDLNFLKLNFFLNSNFKFDLDSTIDGN